MSAAASRIDFALLRKKPVEWISRSSVGGSAAANAAASVYFANSAGVTLFTRSSVHWADSIVAARSWSGVRKPRAHLASGYVSRSVARIACTRSGSGPVQRLRRGGLRVAGGRRETRSRATALALAPCFACRPLALGGAGFRGVERTRGDCGSFFAGVAFRRERGDRRGIRRA